MTSVLQNLKEEFSLNNAALEFDEGFDDENVKKWKDLLNESGISTNSESDHIIYICNDSNSNNKTIDGYKLLKCESNVAIYEKEENDLKRKRDEIESNENNEINENKKIKLGETSQNNDIQESQSSQNDFSTTDNVEKMRNAEISNDNPIAKEEEEKVLQEV